jgi:alkanesulfonate monooxygenase SsuD/methylene tetrahydromethanopterin reductase-like flavin-dependent oxidoreductase (luciferase family)
MASRGIFLPPFDDLADPARLALLAADAEAAGWDGFFVWDHITYRSPVREVLDPWIVLAAIAAATERIRLGPLVTPLSRRRVHKLARETVTLDLLSRGRLILGVGLGSDNNDELEPFGEVVDPRARARLLDDGLEQLDDLWGGGFEPRPVQRAGRGGIPVWVAGRWPNRRPVARAARWDGMFPIELAGPDALVSLEQDLRAQREASGGSRRPFDLVCEISPGRDPEPWERAGATWVLTGFPIGSTAAEVAAAIEAGPGRPDRSGHRGRED